jgi:hypothetical protein
VPGACVTFLLDVAVLVAVFGNILALSSAYNVVAGEELSNNDDPMNAVKFLFQRLLNIFGTMVLEIVAASRESSLASYMLPLPLSTHLTIVVEAVVLAP